MSEKNPVDNLVIVKSGDLVPGSVVAFWHVQRNKNNAGMKMLKVVGVALGGRRVLVMGNNSHELIINLKVEGSVGVVDEFNNEVLSW